MHEGHRERMKEKAISHSDSLLPHEIMELLLFYSIPRKNVNEIAHSLLKRFNGSVKSVLEADPKVLTEIDGVGENTACFLKVINTIVSYVENEKPKIERIKNLYDAKKEFCSLFRNANREIFVMYFLGSDNIVLGKCEMTDNKVDSVDIDFKEVSKLLLAHKPASVLLAHNHLSGNPNPSLADDATTKRLLALLSLNNVSLYDHIIVSEEKVYSYFSQGRLQQLISNLDSVL